MKSPKKLILASMLTVSLGGLLPVFAQDPNPASPAPSGGWRKFDPSNPADVPPPAPDYQEPQAQTQAPPPPGRYQTQPPPAASYPSHPAPVQPPPVYPSSITIPAGTWLTVRVDQPVGDTLTLPVEETPTQFRFPTRDGPIIINRVTGELFLSQDVGASGTCALEPTKF